jgi:hypothetical protein
MSKGRTKDVRDPALLCHAHRTNGDMCGAAYVIRGGAGVCKAQGGAAPQTRQKAQEQLEAMRMPALAEINRILRDPTSSDEVKVRSLSPSLTALALVQTCEDASRTH